MLNCRSVAVTTPLISMSSDDKQGYEHRYAVIEILNAFHEHDEKALTELETHTAAPNSSKPGNRCMTTSMRSGSRPRTEAGGFAAYACEWWHFPGWSRPTPARTHLRRFVQRAACPS